MRGASVYFEPIDARRACMSFDGASFFTVGRVATRVAPVTEAARAAFRTRRALLCRPGVDAEMLVSLAAFCGRAAFRPQPVEGVGHRHVETPPVAGNAIQLALGRPALLDWLTEVTDCGPLSRIEGCVVETRPGGIDQLDWHRDTQSRARLGLALHLTDCAYEGGAFELRESGASDLSFRHANARAGDVVVFDIDNRLEHRVCPVLAGAARLVFTGWFIA